MTVGNIQHVVISGSSTTEATPWPTWATWAKSIFGWSSVTDISARGLGNEAIVLKAIHTASKLEGNVFVIVQLTPVDKWDWYVQNPELVKKIDQEKHPVTRLASTDPAGFWCTGSWFPLWKQHYQEHYLSTDYQCYKTLQMISWFQMICQQQGWQYHILFDSPVLSVTERDLLDNQLTPDQCNKLTLTQNTICETALKFVDLDNIYLPGIVGHCCLTNQPWLHSKFGPHPGSGAHLAFVKDVLIPQLGTTFEIAVPPDRLYDQAQRFQDLVRE